jgi:hypothetical protein
MSLQRPSVDVNNFVHILIGYMIMFLKYVMSNRSSRKLFALIQRVCIYASHF